MLPLIKICMQKSDSKKIADQRLSQLSLDRLFFSSVFFEGTMSFEIKQRHADGLLRFAQFDIKSCCYHGCHEKKKDWIRSVVGMRKIGEYSAALVGVMNPFGRD